MAGWKDAPVVEGGNWRDAPAVDGGDGGTRTPAFLNRGIASVIGAPVDVVNAALSLVGLESEQPFGGSASIESGMRATLGERNVPRPGEIAETPAERAFQGAGEAAGMLLPLGGIARGVGAGAPSANLGRGVIDGARRTSQDVVTRGGLGRTMTAPFVQRPVTAVSAELGAGAAAPVAGDVAERAAPEGYGPLARFGGEIAGGAAGGITASGAINAPRVAARVTSKFPLARNALKAIAPYTPTGGRIGAEDRVRALAGSPVEAAALAEGGDVRLTPAQRTGDPRLMSLEREVVRGDAPAEDVLSSGLERARAELAAEAGLPAIGGDPEQARTFLNQWRARFNRRLTQSVDDALENARTAVRAAGPNVDRVDAAAIVRRRLEDAFDAAKTQEAELWRRIPKDAPVDTARTRAAYGALSEDLAEALRDDMPRKARELLEGDGVLTLPTSVRELHGFYSKMREVARIAGAGPGGGQRNLRRIAGELADAAWLDLTGGSVPDSDIGRQLERARAYSREFNETFTQGTVGRVLGTRREGGDAIPVGETLARTVGRGAEAGATATRDLRRAAGEVDEIGDYMLDQFDRAVRQPDGSIDPQRAERFIRDNAEILEFVPDARLRMREAADASSRLGPTRARAEGLRNAFSDPRRNPGAAFAEADYGKELSGVLRSRNPQRAARALRRQAEEDASGAALAGVRRAAVARALSDATTSAGLTGKGLRNMLADPATRGALNELLPPDAMRRLQRIAGELAKVDTAQGQLPDVGGVAPSPANSLLKSLAGFFGAQSGGRFAANNTGSSLVVAREFSERARRLVDNLTRNKAEALIAEAILSPDGRLLADLLTNTTTREGAARIDRRIPVLLGVMAQSAPEE